MSKPDKPQSRPTFWMSVNGRVIEGRVKRVAPRVYTFEGGRYVVASGGPSCR